MTDTIERARWQADVRIYGEDEAYVRAHTRASLDEHSENMRKIAERREAWKIYVSFGEINDLVTTAKDLVQVIQAETHGKIEFTQDPMGDWQLKGSRELAAHLNLSSDVEREIWGRIAGRGELISKELNFYRQAPSPRDLAEISNTSLVRTFVPQIAFQKVILSPETLNQYFGKHYRDFATKYEGSKPRTIESAFNHIPELGMPLNVVGFPYPHRDVLSLS